MFTVLGYSLFSGIVNNKYIEDNKDTLLEKMYTEEISVFLNDFLSSLVFFAKSGFS